MGAGECRRPCGALVYIHNDSFFSGDRDLVRNFFRDFFSSRPQYGILETGISRSNRFGLAPSSGGGSNALRPALSGPNLDVNADGGWARQARSCKKCCILRRLSRGFCYVLTSEASAKRDSFQNWHHFQTIVAKVLNVAVVYSRAFHLHDVCRARTNKIREHVSFNGKWHRFQIDIICKLLSQPTWYRLKIVFLRGLLCNNLAKFRPRK